MVKGQNLSREEIKREASLSYSPSLPGTKLPPPVSIDGCDDWYVFVARRSSAGRFSKWAVTTRAKALRWGQMQVGVYSSMQAYPDRPAVGTCKGKVHHSLFWMDFDAPSLLESCRAAWETIGHLERTVLPPELDEYSCFTIRYSGNRSIHLGIDLQLQPSAGLTAGYKLLAAEWKAAAFTPHLDIGVYTEPRLLSVPGSIRYDTGRRIVVLTLDSLLEACDDPTALVERATTEAQVGKLSAPSREARDWDAGQRAKPRSAA